MNIPILARSRSVHTIHTGDTRNLPLTQSSSDEADRKVCHPKHQHGAGVGATSRDGSDNVQHKPGHRDRHSLVNGDGIATES